ncbi:hypothetical protein SAGO17_0086 [Mimivirus AB-566-O17]|uniref:Minor capsid protein P11 C-terminal conserved region domain-containing protein n=1 Tax=Mimivirus AB-566-O17 TaxID=1988039 RepID=A0A1X9VNU5_9VIRU|nr:hypothetical protein SAGO17_0086 [Mimivirus AB-566-O17]
MKSIRNMLPSGLKGPLFELLKMVVVVFGIFALLHFLKQYYEPMVDFESLQAYDSMKSQYQIATPSTTFQEGAPVPEQEVVSKVIVGEDTLKAEELLPSYDEANEFAKQNPVTELLKEQNYLISGYNLGINSTSQSSKIPYHDLRSLPPVPKADWLINNSSLDRSNAFQRRSLDIGH